MTRRIRVSIVVLSLLGLLAAACGREQGSASTSTESAEPETVAFDGPLTVIVANSPGTLIAGSRQRIMTALVGQGPNEFLGGPDQEVTVSFSLPEADGTVGGHAEGEWLTTDASSLGLYVSFFEFEAPGRWEVRVSADGRDLGGALVGVVEESAVPNVGEPAPATESATASTPEEIAAISTDPDPDPSFYELSIAEAVANGRPTVVVFATPAFCRTALCGPTIEFVKAAAQGRDGLDVVHVEPFDLELAPQGILEPIPSMADWGLATEPWVFVIDEDGLVAATFEGIIGQAELEDAIDRL